MLGVRGGVFRGATGQVGAAGEIGEVAGEVTDGAGGAERLPHAGGGAAVPGVVRVCSLQGRGGGPLQGLPTRRFGGF